MKEEKDIEQLFRSSFDGFEVTPPPGVRDAIARRIASPWYRKPWLLLSLAAVLIAGGTLFFIIGDQASITNNPSALASDSDRVTSSRAEKQGATTSNTSSELPTGDAVTTAGNSTNKQDKNDNSTNGTSAAGGDRPSTSSGNNSSTQRSTRNRSNTAAGSKAGKQQSASGTKSGGKSGTGNRSNRAGQKGSKTAQTARQEELKQQIGTQLDQLAQIEAELAKYGISSTTGAESFHYDIDRNPEALAEEIKLRKQILQNELTKAEDEKQKAELAKAEQARKDSIAKVELEKANKAIQDSIAKANEAKAEEPVKETPPPPKKKDDSYKWRSSLYGAIYPTLNTKKTDADFGISSNMAMRYMSAELQRVLPGNWNVSAGLSYSSRSETFFRNFSETSTYYVGFDSIPIMQGDTIIGYEYYENYDTTVTTWTNNYNKTTSSFGIPFFFGRSIMFGQSWGADVLLGGNVQFNKVKSTGDVETTAPTYNKTGVQGFVRLNATYNWKQFVFSAGVNAGYDFKPSVVYADYKRKLVYLGPQIGIHYRF